MSNLNQELVVPKRVFIVPYRNRIQQKFFFSKYMSFILEEKDDYEIYFSHQCDARTFNRGAVKNIGFLAVKNKYPEHYKDITFIFNDVDTIPFYKIFDYETSNGIVKHYYGYKYALGGIVVMKGSDFEKTNGFPCFWGWGMEDNVLQKRCENIGLKIDRSVFYNIGSPEILQLFDGISRIISKKDPWRGENDNGIDGLKTISQIKYSIDEKSENPNDNYFIVENSRIQIINISTFMTYIPFGSEEYYNYDLREPKRKIINPDKIKETKKTVVTTNDWSNIPYYPTTREKKENVAKYLISMGKQVPPELIKQISEDTIREINQDVYNNFNKKECDNLEEQQPSNLYQQQQPPNLYHQQQPNLYRHQQPSNLYHQQPSNLYHQQPSNLYHQQPSNLYQQNRFSGVNKYSPQYANYIGAKPRAQASARIGMGGAY
jgi:hypothetical protein